MTDVTIKFDNEDAADHFLTWLSVSGEQDYWRWMAEREQEDKGPITAVDLTYDWDNHSVETECGRLDNEVD